MSERRFDYVHTHLFHHLLFYSDNRDCLEPDVCKEVFIESPYPLSMTFDPLPKVDPFEELLKSKKEYHSKLQTFKRAYACDKRITYRGTEKAVNLPRYVLDLCENKIQDPDEHFSSDCGYNWYYTGGTLDYVTLNTRNYVIYPKRNSDLNFVDIDNFDEFTIATNFEEKRSIYGIESTVLSDGTLLISLREKYKNTIFTVDSDEGFCVRSQCALDTDDTPLVDVKLNSFCCKSVAVAKVSHNLEIYDIHFCKRIKRYCMSNNTEIDAFSHLQYLDKNTLIYADRNELSIVDDRVKDIVDGRLGLGLDGCDKVCTFLVRNDHTLYIATRHSFVKYDIRMFKNFYRYSHMLEQPPYLISCDSGTCSTDLVCLSNQHTKVLLTDNGGFYDLPFEIPSIMTTFNNMQLNKYYSGRNIQRRLHMSTVGVKLLRTCDNQFQLFSLSSVGDLYKQKISDNNFESRSGDRLSEWIEKLPPEKTHLKVTGIAEMSGIWFTLSEARDDRKHEVPKKEHKIPVQFFASDGIDKNDFGKHLEDAWSDDDESSALSNDLEPEMHTVDKVSEWLQNQFNNE